jgi:hypothetical protein
MSNLLKMSHFLPTYTGLHQKKRPVHSSLIYRRILIIYTPNEMVVNRLQNGLINSRIAPWDSKVNCQNIFFSNGVTLHYNNVSQV